MPAPLQAAAVARALGEELVLEVLPGSPDLADVREALDRMAPVEIGPGDVRTALGGVITHATLNPYASVASRHPVISRLKLVVRKLTFFVAHDLTVQVSNLAHSLLVAGSATADRLELLEAENAHLRQEIQALQRRFGQDGR
ncbi:MAG: hypothetical protein WKF86_01665 [Acidimicrobiales bacterium]